MVHGESEKPAGGSEIKNAFRKQADNCRELGSPFVERICHLFADRLQLRGAVMQALLNWPDDGSFQAVPLRLAGALHCLVLEGRSKELATVFPPHQSDNDDDALWNAIDTAITHHADFILAGLQSAPQTNEVRRAAALLPGFLTIASLTRQPLVLSEVGASAGLNLCWDRFGYRLGEMSWGDAASPVLLAPEWTGAESPTAAITVHERAGCDLLPLDPNKPEDCTRLLSYVWPDQGDRITRTRAALAIARRERLQVERADVLQWLRKRLGDRQVGTVHVIYHTIVWPYFSRDTQEAVEGMIRKAGVEGPDNASLAWLRLEPDGDGPGAALMLSLWPMGEERCIGRADFHGRWVNWVGW